MGKMTAIPMAYYLVVQLGIMKDLRREYKKASKMAKYLE